MVSEAVLAGVAVVDADEEPDEAVQHFSDSSPMAAMANLCSRITLAAFATPFFPVGTCHSVSDSHHC